MRSIRLSSMGLVCALLLGGGLMGWAQKTPTAPVKPTIPTPTTSAKSVSPIPPQPDAPSPNGVTSKSHAKESTKPSLPLTMTVSTAQDSFLPKQDIYVKADFYANQPVTLCFYPDRPDANFSVDIYRAGHGAVAVPPKLVQLDQKDLGTIQHVPLKAGESYSTGFNVKKLVQLPPGEWVPGEYSLKLKFYLCGKTEHDEIDIPGKEPLHVLILD